MFRAARHWVDTYGVSLDSLFDLLAVLVFVVLPLALALIAIAGAIRTSSWFWRVPCFAVAVGGTWIAMASAVSIAQCPSQDEMCGEQSGIVGNAGTEIAIVISIVYVVLIPLARWRGRSRSAAQDRRHFL